MLRCGPAGIGAGAAAGAADGARVEANGAASTTLSRARALYRPPTAAAGDSGRAGQREKFVCEAIGYRDIVGIWHGRKGLGTGPVVKESK